MPHDNEPVVPIENYTSGNFKRERKGQFLARLHQLKGSLATKKK